jgi:hypothetical protein
MSRYDSMIDGTDFGVVAGYLLGPHSPIRWLLHVRERGMLGEVAELIERSEQLGLVRPDQFPWVVKPYLWEGKMLLSTRPGSEMENEATIDTSLVPRNARSEVIYMEPSYLVHTPGLFEKQWELEIPTRPHSDEHLLAQLDRMDDHVNEMIESLQTRENNSRGRGR